MGTALKTQSTKTKIKLYQNKKLHSRGNNQPSKRQPTEWENIFANHIANNEVTSKIHKEFTKQYQKNTEQSN